METTERYLTDEEIAEMVKLQFLLDLCHAADEIGDYRTSDAAHEELRKSLVEGNDR